MKIGFFIPSVGRGGVESSLAKLLHTLSGAGFDLTLLYGEAPADWLESIRGTAEIVQLQQKSYFPFAGRLLGSRASISISLIRDLTRFLKGSDIDVLVGYQSGAVALLARRRAGVDTPVVVRESIVPSIAFKYESKFWALLKRRIKAFTFSRAVAVIGVCEGASNDLIDNFGVPASIVNVIYNPAIPPDLEALKAEKIEHAWFDDSEKVPVISSVGRLSSQKDIPTTFRAISELLKTRDVRLVVVGEGPLGEELQALAAELGIEKSVWFAGFQSNPYKFMAQSDVFVLTSVYEGIANVLAEALACGVPAVATDCPTGPTEVLLGGRAGLLEPVGDHVAIGAAIQRHLDDPSLNDSFSNGAAESIARFQPDAAASSYLKLMSKLIT